MSNGYLVTVEKFCTSHGIEISLIRSLEQYGMIEVVTIKEISYINTDQLHELEKIILFYRDMDINFEGIETVNHLLSKIFALQDEIRVLKNRLNLFEGGI